MKKIMISIIVTVVVLIGVCGIDMYRNYCAKEARNYAEEWLEDYRSADHDCGTFTRIDKVGIMTYEIGYCEWSHEDETVRTISYVPFKGIVNEIL